MCGCKYLFGICMFDFVFYMTVILYWFLSSVSVMEVECVREGCQSETLRKLAGSVPEEHCLTIVFKGGRKSLDLQCQSIEEAQHWARGICMLQDRINNMSHTEKLDQYPLTASSWPNQQIGLMKM